MLVRKLEEQEIRAAGELAARAFADDPASSFVLPNRRRRARYLVRFLSAWVRYGHLCGEVWTTADLEGDAVWLRPPGKGNLSARGLLHSGLLGAGAALWPREFFRGGVLDLHASLIDLEPYRNPHYYLALLAVEPERQGRGIGGALLAPMLQQADGEGMPCGLTTQKQENVRFYEKHGFRVKAAARCPLGGPEVWTMGREPRRESPTESSP